ncbi:hypothetical protein AAF712_014684 [Marasmius tenuissimus]|uniref:Exocyst subunit Exo70 family protein n=1 Tax=Marasmius tenuissimus TaxID=585030 RepID=A0ABR2ZCX5_9AGAR
MQRFPSSSTKSKVQPEEAVECTANDVLAAVSGISILVLETLQDVARLAPAPYLSVVSSAALRILETVQEFKGNEQGFKKLGTDTCNLVYAIAANCLRLTENNGAVSPGLEGNLKQLWKYGFHDSLLLGIRVDDYISRFLKQIQGYVDKQLCRSRISRFLMHKSGYGAVRGYRDDLKHRLHTFGVLYQSF